MEPSSRDRISVDLNGLKATLVARAQAMAVSPSELVRQLLAKALVDSALHFDQATCRGWVRPPGARKRICLRMGVDDAAALLAAARTTGMSPGEFVAGLVAGVPAIQAGRGRADHMAALTASNTELATLSRSIFHLSTLLRQAELAPAMAYRDMLDTLSGDVRRHLDLASGVLTELVPRGRSRPLRRP